MGKRNVSSYIFRNADAAIKYRNEYFQKALGELKVVIDAFDAYCQGQVSWDEFSVQIMELIADLKEARYYGRWSIGWEITDVPAGVDLREVSIVDHIETTYSNMRTIHRLLRHEEAVKAIERRVLTDDKDSLRQYADEVILGDENHIKILFDAIWKRVQVFRKEFAEFA